MSDRPSRYAHTALSKSSYDRASAGFAADASTLDANRSTVAELRCEQVIPTEGRSHVYVRLHTHAQTDALFICDTAQCSLRVRQQHKYGYGTPANPIAISQIARTLVKLEQVVRVAYPHFSQLHNHRNLRWVKSSVVCAIELHSATKGSGSRK